MKLIAYRIGRKPLSSEQSSNPLCTEFYHDASDRAILVGAKPARRVSIHGLAIPCKTNANTVLRSSQRNLTCQREQGMYGKCVLMTYSQSFVAQQSSVIDQISTTEYRDTATSTFHAKRFACGRQGQLCFADGHVVETPHLYPVASLITGTTASGGGLWKYVLHAHPDGLLRRQIPLMTQVLHFLDFGVSPHAIEKWRTATVREHYNRAYPDLNYTAPLFLDSGGFKLLWTRELDLSRYGIQATPEAILCLQRDFGSELIATLDYPLPPGLVREEAEERMRLSRANALATIRLLREQPDYHPVVYLAVHGQDGDDIRRYVNTIFDELGQDGWPNVTVGIAVGSLVPLRGAKKVHAIAEMVRGAVAGIPEERRDQVPVHVFGITGNLVPLLAYLGVDTFDSSTYAQEARSLGYLDPVTHRAHGILDMDGDFPCHCRICRATSLRAVQDGLTHTPTYLRSDRNGNHIQKSRFYADIALHNLEMDLSILSTTREALVADALTDHLIEHVTQRPQFRDVLASLAQHDGHLRRALTHASFPLPSKATLESPQHAGNITQRSISTRHTPESFDLLERAYLPPQDKLIALLIPCSGGKPYSTSRSHRLIAERLSRLGECAGMVHKVTISGLYGPVPEEFETLPEILTYDFRLDPMDISQIELVSRRVEAFLTRYGANYRAVIGYATSRSYRTVLEHVAQNIPTMAVLPESLKTRRLTEFFRQDHISALMERIAGVLPQDSGNEEGLRH